MTNNKKAAQVASTGTASNNTLDKPNSTKANEMQGWYYLGADIKPSRTERTPKRSRK